MALTIEHVEKLQDHWWWRPGWRPGRHLYACHFTMDDQPALRQLVAQYQEALRRLPGLDLIPARWLHLTMQGIGFVDGLDSADVDEIAQAIRRNLANLTPPVVTFGCPVVRPEAVYLPAEPDRPIAALRAAVREAIAEALGEDRAEVAPDHLQGYRPHVSIAYSNTEQAAEPIVEALSGVQAEPVVVTLGQVELLEFHRDRRMYEWTSAQPLRIGTEAP